METPALLEGLTSHYPIVFIELSTRFIRFVTRGTVVILQLKRLHGFSTGHSSLRPQPRDPVYLGDGHGPGVGDIKNAQLLAYAHKNTLYKINMNL